MSKRTQFFRRFVNVSKRAHVYFMHFDMFFKNKNCAGAFNIFTCQYASGAVLYCAEVRRHPLHKIREDSCWCNLPLRIWISVPVFSVCILRGSSPISFEMFSKMTADRHTPPQARSHSPDSPCSEEAWQRLPSGNRSEIPAA